MSEKTTADKLAAASRARDTVPICLVGELRAEYKQTLAQFEAAQKADAGMMQPSSETKELAQRIVDLEAAMREHTIEVTVEALRRVRTPATPKLASVWREICDQHPPRKGKNGKVVEEDAAGFNAETFPEALIRACIVALDGDPVTVRDERVDELLELCTEGQGDQLFEAVWRLNKSRIDIPFSFAASTTARSGPASRKRSGSGSRSSGSKAGNPKK